MVFEQFANLVVSQLGLTGALSDTVYFWIYDTLKITAMLVAVIFGVGYLRTYFPPEKISGLAENISEAQTRENRQMAEWLRQQGYQRPRNGHRMAGMASQEQMQRLENSEGKDFDRLFAELMIEHHRGGIEMARNFREVGRYSELKNMQTGMIQAQQTEIEKMKKWQKQGF